MRRTVGGTVLPRTGHARTMLARTGLASTALALTAVAAGLLLAWPAGPAMAAPPSARPVTPASARPAARERFHLTSSNAAATRQHMQATGTLTARGYALAGDFASHHAVSRLVFRHGALRLVTKATHSSESAPDATTCKFTEVFSGGYVIRGGAGRYRHATGSGSYVSRIFGKLKEARGGGCSARLASFRQSTRTSGSLHR